MHDVCKVDLGVTNAKDILQDSDINMVIPINKRYLYEDIYHLLLLLAILVCILLLSVIDEIGIEGMLQKFVVIYSVEQINYLSATPPSYQSTFYQYN